MLCVQHTHLQCSTGEASSVATKAVVGGECARGFVCFVADNNGRPVFQRLV